MPRVSSSAVPIRIGRAWLALGTNLDDIPNAIPAGRL
jgi:hypothetical protein